MSRTLITPGHLEVFCGPMKSGKSEAVIYRLSRFAIVSDNATLIVKPNTDTRDPHLRSRAYNVQYVCRFAPYDDPMVILDMIDSHHQVLIIDEAQFFGVELVDVVREALLRKLHVIISGLDLDFRGEPFGPMPRLLSLADEVHKLTAVCDVCKGIATRTQRLINGKPAPYNSPLVLVGDGEAYQARCLTHHDVPGRS